MKTYVGIDFHKRFSYGTIMTDSGTVLKHGRFANHPGAVESFLNGYDGRNCSAVLEATRSWQVMHDWLEDRVGQVTLAHPQKVRAIAEASIKNDKIDSGILAHLLRCNLIPASHVSSPRARVVRRLLRHRTFLVRVRTMTKNRIHDLLDRYPAVRAEWTAENLFSGVGIDWMRQAALPDADREILDSELTLLEHLNGQVSHMEKLLKKVGRSDRRLQRLQTIPGIGPCIGMLVLAEVDSVERFSSPAKLHAYAGLIPTTHASGGKVYHGRVVQQCNKYLRWAMVEAVWPAIRKDPQLRVYYDRLAKRKSPNTAKIATARRLLTIIYRVLKEQRDYYP